MSKILTAYFSHKGQNYVSGKIVELTEGNTSIIAHKIQQITNSDIFEIDTVKDYPEDYYETTNVAKKEFQENARPELTAKLESIDGYDTIILCYPNWWGTFPMAVMTFLDSYDFSGKIILPLSTHEGSKMGNSENDLIRALPNSDIREGLPVQGSFVNSSDSLVTNWLERNNII